MISSGVPHSTVLPLIEHQDFVAELLDQGQVMADKKKGQLVSFSLTSEAAP